MWARIHSFACFRYAAVLLGMGVQTACGSADDTLTPEHVGELPEEVSSYAQPCEGLDSGYAGDTQCILPPPAGEGMQLHYGPRAGTA